VHRQYHRIQKTKGTIAQETLPCGSEGRGRGGGGRGVKEEEEGGGGLRHTYFTSALIRRTVGIIISSTLDTMNSVSTVRTMLAAAYSHQHT
jgi:hypothetical protein